MSRSARVVLTVLVSLGIIAAVFMSVQVVSASFQKESLGMYLLNGGLVNPLEEKMAPEQAAPQVLPETYPKGEGGGHGGCESEYIDPNDL